MGVGAAVGPYRIRAQGSSGCVATGTYNRNEQSTVTMQSGNKALRVATLSALIALVACSWLSAQERPSAQDNPPASSGKAQPSSSSGEPAGNATESLQKATQNPVADLISVPIQDNANFGIGPNNRSQNVLNIQPVIPTHLTESWNLITRIIQPIVWQPYPDSNSGGNYGFGDMNPSFFLSPAKPGKIIWGAGPTFVLPTATDDALGQGKWSVGPSFVALAQPGHWTLGFLINNVWSVAGPSNRADVNQMLFQYFINYNLDKGWYLAWQPIITANWNAAKGGDVWTVPIGGGVGRIMKIGFQPVNLQAQAYANLAYPSGGSPWGIRLQIAFLFPKLTPQQETLMLEKKLKELRQQAPQN
jgi:hypothetical protein